MITLFFRYKIPIFFFLSAILMLPGFYINLYKAANKKDLDKSGWISESLVYGRLSESRKSGLLSHGAFFGCAMEEGDTTMVFKKQATIYLENKTYPDYSIYRTIDGFSGFLYGLADKMTSFSPEWNIRIFRLFNALLLTIALSLVVVFFLQYTGIMTAVSVLLSILFSLTMAAFATNLFFCLWAFYIPLLAVMYILAREDLEGKFQMKNALFLIFLSIIVKGLFNGFEFITTILVMMMTPLFFFWIRNKWPFKTLLKRLVLFSLAALAGVFFNMLLLAGHISVYEKDAAAGFNHIAKSWEKRTYETGSDFEFDEKVRESLQSNVAEVLKTHAANKAYRLWPLGPYSVSFGVLSVLYLLATLVLWASGRFRGRGEEWLTDKALMAMTWISFLAPLSWFIIFKGHAYVHVTLDTLAWFFPFVLFGAALTGRMLQSLYYLMMKLLNVRASVHRPT